ncbi:opioid-binding protein/cell adhesion molecule homolog, partial [Condylostylus longicornis]|uniref:opioid-binding protein/cell adhesion molecule homolog n=1 Tax=Condylostylus longicornis TaxID=2530218 RepID=UPI00244E0D14
ISIFLADPKFSSPISNVTISVGREAVLTCKVHDLNSYKVAWLRVDTQTILTIQNHVITKNHRISISQTEHRIWQLRIRDVRDTDRGWYMCQINTDPMKSQVGYLDVVVPPDIVDKETSHDIVVEEGHNATLICTATGLPPPIITWRREKEKPILASGNKEVYSIEGQFLFLKNVQRHQMGAYLCIASNGIPPTVSKRVLLVVNFAPTIWTPNEIIYAQPGQKILLECISESYPTSVNYWLKDKEIIQGGTYESVTLENIFRIVMKLTIRPIKPEDFGEYKCVAKNSLGESSKIITILERRREDVFLTARASEVIDGNNLANYQHDISTSSSLKYSKELLNSIIILSFIFFSISIV